MLRLSSAMLLAAASSFPAHAATLRSQAVLSGPVVHLSDLFRDAGPLADRVLGPGPAPGARQVVEAAQLQAIARQFGVDWQPASAADSIVLDRPGRPLPREAVAAALRAALGAGQDPAGGDGPQMDVDLAGFVAPMVPPDSAARPVVDQLDSDPATGRFTASLSITTPGSSGDVQQFRVNGQVRRMAILAVPVRRLAAGEVIGAEDVRLARVPVTPTTPDAATGPGQVAGLSPRHQLAAGQPIPLAELAPPLLVQRGAAVSMQLDGAGLSLTANGRAIDSGGMGERVRVLNPSSRAIVDGVVSGQGRVRVLPGSVAILPQGRSPGAAPRGLAQAYQAPLDPTVLQ